MRSWLLGSLVFFVGAACSGDARAQQSPGPTRAEAIVRVSRGAGAEGCPDAPTLAHAVSTALGRPSLAAATPGASGVHTAFDVTFARVAAGKGFSAVLRATGRRSGERTLSEAGDDCAGLGEALTTMLVIVLDPQTTSVTIDVPAAPPLAVPPEEGPAPDEEAAPRVLPGASRSSLRVRAGAGLALTQGLLPETAAAVRAELTVRGRAPFSLAPGLLYAPEQSRALPPGEVSVSLFSGALAGCYLPFDRGHDSRALPRLSLCLVPMAGALRGIGRGYETPRSVSRPWAAIGVDARLEGDLLGPLGWTFGGSAIAPITREKLAVTGLGLVHDPPPVAFVGTLGLRITLR